MKTAGQVARSSCRWGRWMGGGLGVVLVLLALTSAASATTLVDQNSTATFELDSTTPPTGLVDWVVDGVDQAYEQWFYYRVGDTGAEMPVNSLDRFIKTSDVDEDDGSETLYVRYSGSGFDIKLIFTLTGGTPGSLRSDMAETIQVINTGTTGLDFHLFQYCDFDLNNTPGDDKVVILNGRVAQQFDPYIIANETVVSPKPSHYEVAYDDGILARLNDTGPTTLQDIAVLGGYGDAVWAFQWDFMMAPGGTQIISKDKNFFHTPEPVTVMGLFMGVSGIGLYIRRRRVR